MSDKESTVIIVGAGLVGICASYYLAKNNIPHLILEKSDQAGGIWSAMRWPGIRCDTEIINYSYSFRPFTSERYLVPGESISRYLQDTADEFGISSRIRFNTHVQQAEFCRKDNRWRLVTDQGVYQSRYLVNANGYFSDTPYWPEFEGVDDFRGDVMHLFDVDEHTPLRGKRIVLVGSGASAISAAPALTRLAASMTLLQRSPSYIYEQDNDIGWFTRLAQNLYRVGIGTPLRQLNFLLQMKSDLAFVLFRKFPGLGKSFFRQHWKDTVDGNTYREHFQPSYNPWQQRIPVAIGLKDVIRNKQLNLVTGRIDRFIVTGIQLEDGRRIDADMCILATGFSLKFFRFPVTIDGERVDTRRINFFKGMMMGGIPNYFQPFGPPHSSFTRRVEAVSRLIVTIIQHMNSKGYASVEIPRTRVPQTPRITPSYVMRELPNLPAFYGTTELPTIDNLLFFHFRAKDYRFSTIQESSETKRFVDDCVTDLEGSTSGG